MDATDADERRNNTNKCSGEPTTVMGSSDGDGPAAAAPAATADGLLQAYEPIPYALIEAEMEVFQKTKQELDREWEEECQKYEKTMQVSVDDDGKILTVPRRNYLNTEGTVVDETLYPYHTAFYPLLDAYDNLYEADDVHPISKHAFRPFGRNDENDWRRGDDDNEEEGYMPASLHAIVASLIGGESHRFSDNAHDIFRLVEDAGQHILRHISDRRFRDNDGALSLESIPNKVLACTDPERFVEVKSGEVKDVLPRSGTNTSALRVYGPSGLPHNRKDRTTVLLSLLRHSLSELQRDPFVAAGALYQLIRFRDLDEIDVFRKVLLLLDAESVVYGKSLMNNGESGRLHSLRDQYCSFYQHVVRFLFAGVSRFTQDHAVSFSAFVRFTYLRKFGSLVPETSVSGSIEDRRSRRLRRTIAELRAEDDEEDRRVILREKIIPVDLFQHLIRALQIRMRVERDQLERLDLSSIRHKIPDILLFGIVDSFHNCVRSIVSTAFSTIQLLPEHNRFYRIAESLFIALCRCFETEGWKCSGRHLFAEGNRFGSLISYQYAARNYRNPDMLTTNRLSSPFRLSDCITKATKRYERVRQGNKVCNSVRHDPLEFSVRKFQLLTFVEQPPGDIGDAIKGLFLRNMVDSRRCGYGYGDAMCWSRFAVSPLDPMLFWAPYNFPIPDEESDSDDDEEEESVDENDQPAEWDNDTNEHSFTVGETRARMDFSLLMLLRAWQAPWTPESHQSFQPEFRKAVVTLTLCTHRLGFPHEVLLRICSFFSRDWWEDPRNSCWSYLCLQESAMKSVAQKFSMAPGKNRSSLATSYLKCSRCQVAMYCSEECRDEDYKTCHKKLCCRPPLLSSFPDTDEIHLCRNVNHDTIPDFILSRRDLEMSNVVHIMPVSSANAAADDDDDVDLDDGIDVYDDDDGSWETVESDEEGSESEESRSETTIAIHAYFERKADSLPV